MKLLFFVGIFLIVLCIHRDVSAQWSQTNTPKTDILCLAVSGANVYAGSSTLFSSTDNGISWNNTGAFGVASALAIIDTIIFVGTDSRGVYRSTDNGSSWGKVNNGLNNAKDLYIWGLGVSDTTLFALSQFRGAFRSLDFGENWTQADSGLPSTRVYALIASGTNLFAGTGSGLYLSTNDGANWIAMNNSMKNTTVTSFVLSGSYIYAGSYRGIFRSADGGTNWSQVNNGLTDTIINSLALSGVTLFAGTNGGGVFRLTDKNSSWSFMSKDLPDLNINVLALNDQYLFAGTRDTGVWRFPLSSLDAVEQSTPTMNGLILHPNYPNPFSNQTTISFSTSKREFVDVKIFDILGRECTNLFSGELEAGEHSYEWNTFHLPPGVYTCIIHTADGAMAEQPIIIR